MINFMRHTLAIILLGIFLITIGCRSVDDNKGENKMENDHRDKSQLLLMDAIDQKQLREIQYWVIKTGVADFYTTRDMAPVKEYVISKGYDFWINPAIDKYHEHKGKTYHTWARIVIKSRNMLNELWGMEQLEHDGNIYEYWVILEDSIKRNYVYSNCEFMITKAKSQKDERTIIHSSDQFFSEYRITPDFVIYYPKDYIGELHVSSYPKCFQDTDMAEVKNILNKLK